ncbi:MAG: hypothetical protein FWF59_04365 [Turicibacter sp.]|nr:hypothetical protein [Turicibacter sp.]
MLPSDYYDGIDFYKGEFNQPEPPVQSSCCCQQATTSNDGYIILETDLSNPYPF